ncbi:MAG TPA: DUF1570 domain-containing protein [Tepidisphaeraceae bacterium]|nr:DUF1570 domain-containing protein [Tepidisphaeraceae bacterium]
MRPRFQLILVAAVVCFTSLAPPAPPVTAQVRRELPRYEGRHYVIHTDLAGDELREAELRMARMAEEYHRRTRGFAGQVNQKLPFYLFRRKEDYLAAGGMEGSAGFFNPGNDTLMAIAGEQVSADTWHVVQHEGFHQFARFVIGGRLPIWVNEGMAEYFAEGLFTGDSFVTGIVPPARLARIKKLVRAKQYRPFRQMLPLAHADWNAQLTQANYDQAWAMVHFLAHAEGGRYQEPFVNFMRAIGRGQPWERAWLDHFGPADGFEARWADWWNALEADASVALYARATVQTLTSTLARAAAQRQRFRSFEDLSAAARDGTLKIDERDWLPPALLKEAFEEASKLRKRGATLALSPSGAAQTVACTLKDGTRLVGKFTLSGGRVTEVTVTSNAGK